MRRVFLNGCCGLALSLLTGLGVQAQTDQTETLTAPIAHSERPMLNAQKPLASAPNPDEVPEAIARQRQVLAAQRSDIVQAEQKQQAACWQKFAVNGCLREARLARRQALAPLRQQELTLNAQERSWRNEQRERRLQVKQAETPQGAP
jgi:hypothetical protein